MNLDSGKSNGFNNGYNLLHKKVGRKLKTGENFERSRKMGLKRVSGIEGPGKFRHPDYSR